MKRCIYILWLLIAVEALAAETLPTYGFYDPPQSIVPDTLKSSYWMEQLRNDLVPFWATDAAVGEDEPGHFPAGLTYDGTAKKVTGALYTRMIGRQIYVYAMAYMMTGDENYLVYADAGYRYLMQYGKDRDAGGYYTKLKKDGSPVANENRSAQDLAYTVLGAAAYYYVTRDPGAEKEILAARDLLFNDHYFYDRMHNRIRDFLTPDMKAEAPNKKWDLVSELDQINGFMLLSQPVLHEKKDREQFLTDLKKLGMMMVDHFYIEGIFPRASVDQHTNKNLSDEMKFRYFLSQSDFGHTIKSYWMLLQIDKRLPKPYFRDMIFASAPHLLEVSYDNEFGAWSDHLSGRDTASKGGVSWWGFAEQDQFAATLIMMGFDYTDELAQTAGFWSNHFIDKENHEVYSYVDKSGTIYDPQGDKTYSWKNGFHSIEHAVVMYITGCYLENIPVELYFAVPLEQTETFIAKPYLFEGIPLRREIVGKCKVGDRELYKVKLAFVGIH